MERYQDYFIKDGKYVGRFEEAYQRFDDPWMQGSELDADSPSRFFAMRNIRKYQIASLVEFGCGLGYLTNLIALRTRARVVGVDVAPTAIEKARAKFPALDFRVDRVENLGAYRELDAVLFAELTWCVLPQLRSLFDELTRNFAGKYFLHNLVFYKGDTQQYGREYFTSLDEFVAYCPFRLLEWSQSSVADETSSIGTSTIFRIEPK